MAHKQGNQILISLGAGRAKSSVVRDAVGDGYECGEAIPQPHSSVASLGGSWVQNVSQRARV